MAQPTVIDFPDVSRPDVTIVIVTYGQWPLCRRSLEAVAEHTDPVYEVVVVDNASPDGTARHLREHVARATLVFNHENHGFGAAANQGALQARAPYLCFLNSDAFVTAGWLPPLLAVLEGDESVAAVAPRFLNLDGTLQDAGSLVDSSAATFALGHADDPDRIDYRFPRDIDYGSGACLVVRRREFAAVGGFDPVYGMGYYEDVDLGLTLRARGRRTVYEPRSTVRHVQGGSSTFDDATMQLVEANRSTFQTRWAGQLASRPLLRSLDRHPHRLPAARDFNCADRILAVGDRAGRVTSLAAHIARVWQPMLVTLLHGHPSAPLDTSSLLAAGVEVVHGDGDWDAWLDLRRFHYSAVLFGDAGDHERLDPALARTQPQAPRMLDLGPGRDGRRHVEFPGAQDDAGTRRAGDGGVVAGRSPGRRFDVTILEAMSHLGTGPPLSAFERRAARL